VAEWAALHEDELLANWERARRDERLRPIDPCLDMAPVNELVDITDVEVVGTYRLRLSFADGTVGAVDFGEREWRGVFEPLKEPGYFARVEVDPEAGTITWPGGLDMAPEPLYDEARRNKVDAASASR
jgi:hypothetical protein